MMEETIKGQSLLRPRRGPPRPEAPTRQFIRVGLVILRRAVAQVVSGCGTPPAMVSESATDTQGLIVESSWHEQKWVGSKNTARSHISFPLGRILRTSSSNGYSAAPSDIRPSEALQPTNAP